MGDAEKSIVEYTKAIELDSTRVEVVRARALVYYGAGLYLKAISDYGRAIDLDSTFALHYLKRALCYDDLNNYEEALADYSRAINRAPRLAQAYDNRGLMYMMKLGDKDKACADLKTACELGVCGNYDYARRIGDCQ
jgi:tetratricopeptide (TPR) repeat protein